MLALGKEGKQIFKILQIFVMGIVLSKVERLPKYFETLAHRIALI